MHKEGGKKYEGIKAIAAENLVGKSARIKLGRQSSMTSKEAANTQGMFAVEIQQQNQQQAHTSALLMASVSWPRVAYAIPQQRTSSESSVASTARARVSQLTVASLTHLLTCSLTH